MCGIYGCVANDAYNKVLNGLKKLQYRGYDSCGIAYLDNAFNIEKAVGDLNNIKPITTNVTIAFGHTRWATNGVVNLLNAHPHVSYNKKYIIVHNGIIKNAEEIKQDLISKGVNFYSSTDTEVVVNFIAYQAQFNHIHDVLKSLFKVLKGSFSLIIGDDKGVLYLIKQFSPLNIIKSEDGIYISSDISSLPDGKLYSLLDGDVLCVNNHNIYNLNEQEIIFSEHKSNLESLNLSNFSCFMEKEIYETPNAIKSTYLSIKDINFKDIFKNFNKVVLIGCGTAYNSCLIGEHFFKKRLNYDVETYLASNYYVENSIISSTLHIIVSQSGETADCINVAKQVKANNGKILVITNEKLSTIAKMADYHIFINAQKEIAVASTKTYSCQLFVFSYMINKLKNAKYDIEIDNFTIKLKDFIENINVDKEAEKLKNIDKLVMIAKDLDYLTLLEASLKIREIDYIYTLPMYAGELKHGTLSLIEKGRYVLTLNSNKADVLQTSINEIKSRNGEIIDFSKYLINDVQEEYKPIFSVVPFQILSCKVAILNNRNPDMPRNLAKSVTVE